MTWLQIQNKSLEKYISLWVNLILITDLNNLDQVNVNGLSYDDKIVGSNMHKLFDGPVRKVYNPYIEKNSRKDKTEIWTHQILILYF